MKAFDTNTKLSYEKACLFKKSGYDAAIRYVGRLKQASFDIDKVELENILKSGLKLGIVQHCPGKPGILPSKELGIEYGHNAAKFAKEAGYKEGCIIYLDLEDVNQTYSSRKQDIIDYCNYWYDEVLKAGYVPGVYVGYNMWLTSQELYKKLKFEHYWKSFSKVPDVAKRSYEMWQDKQINLHGIDIDPNEITGDKLGNSPVFMMPTKTLVQTIQVFSDGSIEVVK
jgi:hypothetical protein